MRWMDRFRLRLRSLTRRERVERELSDELRFHLEEQIEENIKAGMSREEARYAALRAVGGVARIEEECRDMRRTAWIETTLQDLKYALRALGRSPGFTAVAVLSLALGIGANTAIFSVVHAVLIRPLPFAAPDRLVLVARKGGADDLSMSEYEFLRAHAASLASIAGNRDVQDLTMVVHGASEGIKALSVTDGFFANLGVFPASGREFNADETRPGGPRAIVLTDALARRTFGNNSAVGQSVAIGPASFMVVGVLPPGFWFPVEADSFVPLRNTHSESDNGANTDVLARLKPGVDFRQASAELAALGENFRQTHPDFTQEFFKGFMPVPYRSWLTGDIRAKLLLLFGAVLLLLLIACANLASLLLARLAARRKEIAVRLALGSSAGRLARLFLMENAVLVAAGTLGGIAAASWLLDATLKLFPFSLPSSGIRLDLPVLGFACAAGVLICAGFSFAPILTSGRMRVDDALKSAGRSGAGAARERARSVLVVLEVAMSASLLISAALVIESLYRLHREDLGFHAAGLVTFSTPPVRGVDDRKLLHEVLERVRTIPGVRAVAAVNALPLTGQSNYPAQREGHPEQSIGGMEIRIVTPGYFETMGIRIVRGRALADADRSGSLPVVAINETLARTWWGEANPLGDRVQIGRFRDKVFGGDDPAREVIGVVGDTKTVYLNKPARPTLYVAAAQATTDLGGMSWVVRADSPAVYPRIRQAVVEIDPRQRVQLWRTMDEIVASTTADSRFDAWLFGSFAGLALLLTAVGIYGLLAFFVVQRTGEIGIRLALGATRAGVMRMVMRQGIVLVLIGMAAGLAGAFAITRWFATLLYGVNPDDPATFAMVAVVLLAIGAAASGLPARRATRVDPVVALRYE